MRTLLTRPIVRPVWPWRAALAAVGATAVLWAALESRAASARPRVGLIFEDGACELWPGLAGEIGGPLTAAECDRINRVARAEVEGAFRGLRLDVTRDARAFWTVHVVPTVPARTRMLGAVGASVAMGPLGGRGMVGLFPLAVQARRHAPPGIARADLVTAIGRGIGRSAVHEFAHQIVSGAVDGTDPATYEFASADRPAQYYGTLTWGAAGPRIRARLQ